jgi:hypothetical protein
VREHHRAEEQNAEAKPQQRGIRRRDQRVRAIHPSLEGSFSQGNHVIIGIPNA